jgi:tetratricopeptide (TPR) repeat protein
MIIRPKTKRRVLILLIGVAVFSAGAVWLYSYRMMVAENRLQADKDQGLAAYKAGDFQTAITKLAEYINHTQKTQKEIDPQALLAFANARAKVPTGNQDYIVLAINTLRRYCSVAPDDAVARDQLLEMEAPYTAYAPDALSRATEILRNNPNDAVALKTVVAVNVRQRKFQDAADAAQRYVQLVPTDMEMQRTNFQIMQALGRPGTDMQSQADALIRKYPADPRFKVVKAWAFFYGRTAMETPEKNRVDYKAYHDLLMDAAKADPPTSDFAKTTIGLLYQMAEYTTADDLLNRASKKFTDPDLRQQTIERLFEMRKFDDLISRLASLDATSPAADANLVAYKILALQAMGRDSDANTIADQLATRDPSDHVAAAWVTALKPAFANPLPDLQTRLAKYQQAQTMSPDNGYVAFLLGDVYAQLDESELAVQSFRQSCEQMPSWVEPHVRLAELLVRTGRGASEEAARSAEEARLAGTSSGGVVDLQVAVANIEVSYARLPSNPDPNYRSDLLNEVKQIQAQLPNEPQTLPIFVSLLAQSGQRDAAIDAIQSACANPSKGGEDLLMTLVQTSRDQKLGMEPALFTAIEKAFGSTPRLTYAKAMDKLSAGNAAEGLQLLQDAVAKAEAQSAGTPADHAYWDRAICQYREAARDPQAAAAWKKLGNDYPNDVTVQSAILTNGNSAWADREFIRSTIDRLKALTGEPALAWKTAEARWLLAPGATEKDASAAVVLLTGVTTQNPSEYLPHVLLATAYDHLRNTSSALDEWRKAAALEPQSAAAQYALLEALHKAGRKDEAVNIFDKIAAMPGLQPDLALAAATIIASEGDMQRAENLLLAYPNSTNQVLHDATLAKVYRLEGRTNDAASIYFNLAHAKPLDPNTIREAADFFAAQNKLDEAKKFLDRLDELSLPAGQNVLMQAEFAEEHGSIPDATKLYAEAVKQAGDDPQAAIRQAGFLMRQNDWTAARTALDAAATHWPNDASIANLSKAQTAIANYGRVDELGALIEALTADPTNAAANDTVVIATNPGTTASQARLLLEKYPDFEPLYELTSRRLLWAGNAVEAIATARDAMGRFPHSVNAARMTAEVNASTGNWNDALIAAKQWRTRVTENPLTADQFIAMADLTIGQPQDAVDCLSPYLTAAKAHPDDFQNVLTTYAQALIRSGHEADAAALLMPLAKDSPKWRIVWVNLAPVSYDDGSASGKWIDQVKPLLVADAVDEQEELAEAYIGCAERQKYPLDYTAARDTLKPFIGTPKMGARQSLTYAGAAQGSGDTASAMDAYRRVLAIDPNNSIAQNNLADLLRQDGSLSDLKEAEALVSKAIANHGSEPQAFNYYDTLARVLLKQGRPSDAITAFEKGTQINPKDLDLLIGLASTCATTNRTDAAIRYLSQIDTILPQGAHLTPELKAELDTARQVIHKADLRGSVTGADFSPSGK